LQCELSQKAGHCENDVRIRGWKKFFLPPVDPTKAGVGLALGTVPIPARNGELTISCLMVSNPLWRVRR
jgi:hypothetical protein